MSSKQQSVPTAEQVLAGLFDGGDSWAFVVDGRMRVVQGRPPVSRTPRDAQPPEGRPQPETCHRRWAGSDAPCAGCPVEQVLRTARVQTAEVYVAPEDRWYEIHASPIAAADGAATHALIVPHDITKRKQAEDALRANEETQRRRNERLRALCERNGYRYIDVHTGFSDAGGFMLEEYAGDEIHLNGKAAEHVKRELREKLGVML